MLALDLPYGSSFIDICTVVGAVVVVSGVFSRLLRLKRFFVGHYSQPLIDFKSQGRYAVVTGATDGIGKAFALELAERYGMDLVLISRNLDKLQQMSAELRSKLPHCHVKILSANFERTDIYESLENELDKIDVGVLVNNVGTAITPARLLSEMDRKDVFKMLNVNMTSAVMTSHVVLKNMAAKKRGVIINISSASALLPPCYPLYSTAKTFVRRFSEALRLQYGSLGITVQDVAPYYVATKLGFDTSGPFVIDASTCARQSLRTVGHFDETCGAVRHDLQHLLVSMMPQRLIIKGALQRAKFDKN